MLRRSVDEQRERYAAMPERAQALAGLDDIRRRIDDDLRDWCGLFY
jgi:hypothetical protein